MLIIINFF